MFIVIMLSKSAFETYIKRLAIPPEGVEYLTHLRTGGVNGGPIPPTREVQSRVGNYIVRYPSAKMGFVIPCESKTAEFALTLILERGHDNWEYYAQPPELELHYNSESGRPMVVPHRDDRLVICPDAVKIIEAKTVPGIQKDAAKMPNRYVAVGENRWICPPGQEAAKRLGFTYEIWTPAEAGPALTDNLVYLDAFYRLGPTNFAPGLVHQWQTWLKENPGRPLIELDRAVEAFGPDFFRWGIAYGHFFCDLENVDLRHPEVARVFDSQAVAEAYHLSRTVPSDRSIIPSPTTGSAPIQDALAKALLEHSPEEIEQATARFRAFQGLPNCKPMSPRSKTRWANWQKESKKNHGKEFIGLLRGESGRGNYGLRKPPLIYTLADATIEEHVLVTAGKRPATAYWLFKNKCKAVELKPCSQQWFHLRIKKLELFKRILATKGPRAAYQVAAPAGVASPPGDFPFHFVYIDHTELDVELIDLENGLNLGRPWSSVMRDGASRAILAVHISFDPPGRRSLIALIRECVRLHGRLPINVVVDNGAEFKSEWFHLFEAATWTTIIYVPGHHSRGNSLVENFHSVMNVQFIHLLAGNTQLTKNVRQLTKSLDPAGNPNRDAPFLQGVAVVGRDEHTAIAAMLGQDSFDFVENGFEHRLHHVRLPIYGMREIVGEVECADISFAVFGLDGKRHARALLEFNEISGCVVKRADAITREFGFRTVIG
jgi:putative transposase